MKRLLDPSFWLRALTHPLVLIGLVIDLAPIAGVILWGWGALPLVMIYWMENVIAGVTTIPRIVISGASYGGFGLLAGLGLSAFFVVHYGMFCAVHGTFLVGLSAFSDPDKIQSLPFMDIPGMFQLGFNSGLHVDWMIYAIAAFQVLVLIWEFIFKGEWKTTNPMAEMFAPYSRIIVLHFGIFAGAAALFLLGQPMVGVLALILFRVVWGILTNSKRAGVTPLGEALGGYDKAMDQLKGRTDFQNLLKGTAPTSKS